MLTCHKAHTHACTRVFGGPDALGITWHGTYMLALLSGLAPFVGVPLNLGAFVSSPFGNTGNTGTGITVNQWIGI